MAIERGRGGVEVVADLSSTEDDHSKHGGGGWDGGVGECKRTKGRGRGAEWEATDRRLLLSHPLWLAVLFSQGFDSNLTMIFTRRSPPTFLPPLHTTSGGSTQPTPATYQTRPPR